MGEKQNGEKMNNDDYWFEFSLGFITGALALMIFWPFIFLWVMG